MRQGLSVVRVHADAPRSRGRGARYFGVCNRNRQGRGEAVHYRRQRHPLPYEDGYFDYIISITTLHNFYNSELRKALQEIERVGKQNKHVIVESYRNEREKANLLYWQLTCRSFYTPDEWEWFMKDSGYTGDFSCVYFE